MLQHQGDAEPFTRTLFFVKAIERLRLGEASEQEGRSWIESTREILGLENLCL